MCCNHSVAENSTFIAHVRIRIYKLYLSLNLNYMNLNMDDHIFFIGYQRL